MRFFFFFGATRKKKGDNFSFNKNQKNNGPPTPPLLLFFKWGPPPLFFLWVNGVSLGLEIPYNNDSPKVFSRHTRTSRKTFSQTHPFFILRLFKFIRATKTLLVNLKVCPPIKPPGFKILYNPSF